MLHHHKPGHIGTVGIRCRQICRHPNGLGGVGRLALLAVNASKVDATKVVAVPQIRVPSGGDSSVSCLVGSIVHVELTRGICQSTRGVLVVANLLEGGGGKGKEFRDARERLDTHTNMSRYSHWAGKAQET